MECVLKCRNISKKINKNTILDDISLDISEGDIYGLVGSNGAGKTTLIKSILGLNNIDNGSISICGCDTRFDFKNAISSVGAIVENPEFYEYMSGLDNLKLKCRIYNINSNRLNEVINLLELNDYIDKKVNTYSLGMKQRLGIAFAILNNPKLLILDEPTNGLDIGGIEVLKRIIRKLSSNNIAILISSHILSILDDLCNKVCIIKNGKIIKNDLVSNLKKINNNDNYIFKVSDTSNINLAFDTKIIDDNTFKVNCNREFIPLIIESLIKSDINIYEIVKENITIEKLLFGGINETN